MVKELVLSDAGIGTGAIKRVSTQAALAELVLQHRVSHLSHVSKLLGYSYEETPSRSALLVALEYCEHGSLASYMKKTYSGLPVHVPSLVTSLCVTRDTASTSEHRESESLTTTNTTTAMLGAAVDNATTATATATATTKGKTQDTAGREEAGGGGGADSGDQETKEIAGATSTGSTDLMSMLLSPLSSTSFMSSSSKSEQLADSVNKKFSINVSFGKSKGSSQKKKEPSKEEQQYEADAATSSSTTSAASLASASPKSIGLHKKGKKQTGAAAAAAAAERVAIANAERASWRVLLRMAAECARGLSQLHAMGVVHNDVRADNFLVSGDGICRISDCGLAVLVGNSVAAASPNNGVQLATSTSMSTGVPVSLSLAVGPTVLPIKWSAPEAVACRLCSFQSDVWSFGMLLYELITGATPYAYLTAQDARKLISNMFLAAFAPTKALDVYPSPLTLGKDILTRHTDSYLTSSHLPMIPESVPAGLVDVVRACWAVDPALRPAAHELHRRLEQILNTL